MKGQRVQEAPASSLPSSPETNSPVPRCLLPGCPALICALRPQTHQLSQVRKEARARPPMATHSQAQPPTSHSGPAGRKWLIVQQDSLALVLLRGQAWGCPVPDVISSFISASASSVPQDGSPAPAQRGH